VIRSFSDACAYVLNDDGDSPATEKRRACSRLLTNRVQRISCTETSLQCGDENA
jgi:hypothetical protein